MMLHVVIRGCVAFVATCMLTACSSTNVPRQGLTLLTPQGTDVTYVAPWESPDGAWLFVSTASAVAENPSGTFDIIMVPIDDTSRTDLTARWRALLARIRSEYDASDLTLTPDGSMAVFTRCFAPDGVGNCDLYMTQYVNGQWTEPQNLGDAVNSNGWESSATFAADGRGLLFVSDRYAQGETNLSGEVDTDIFMTQFDTATKSFTPAQRVDALRSWNAERSPFISLTGDSLFFSRRGQIDDDVFVAVLENGVIQPPVRVDAPVSGPGNDRYYRSAYITGRRYVAISRIPGLYRIYASGTATIDAVRVRR